MNKTPELHSLVLIDNVEHLGVMTAVIGEVTRRQGSRVHVLVGHTLSGEPIEYGCTAEELRSWPFEFGWELGVNHAHTGDPRDWSDERCAPLERERDAARDFFRRWYKSGALVDFFEGYDAGYEHEARYV